MDDAHRDLNRVTGQDQSRRAALKRLAGVTLAVLPVLRLTDEVDAARCGKEKH